MMVEEYLSEKLVTIDVSLMVLYSKHVYGMFVVRKNS